MTTRISTLLLAGLLGLPASGRAQWIHYPTAGVPTKADGTALGPFCDRWNVGTEEQGRFDQEYIVCVGTRA